MGVRDKYKSTDNLIEYAQASELGGAGPPPIFYPREIFIHAGQIAVYLHMPRAHGGCKIYRWDKRPL